MLSEVYKNNRQNGFIVVTMLAFKILKGTRKSHVKTINNLFSLYSVRIILTVPPYGLQDQCL